MSTEGENRVENRETGPSQKGCCSPLTAPPRALISWAETVFNILTAETFAHGLWHVPLIKTLVQILLFLKSLVNCYLCPWLESLRANRTFPCPGVGMPRAPDTHPFGRPLGVPVMCGWPSWSPGPNQTSLVPDPSLAITGRSSGPGCLGWSQLGHLLAFSL